MNGSECYIDNSCAALFSKVHEAFIIMSVSVHCKRSIVMPVVPNARMTCVSILNNANAPDEVHAPSNCLSILNNAKANNKANSSLLPQSLNNCCLRFPKNNFN